MTDTDGAVLGIDVGFSSKGRTTCITLLKWDNATAEFTSCRTGSDDASRAQVIAKLVGNRHLHAVALDGPLTRGLELVPHYRAAEAVLSRGALQKRGKPGQTSAPTGQQLHAHATRLAHTVLATASVAQSSHLEPIHPKRIVEAFPNLFLAAMVDEADIPKLSRDASDRYWELVVNNSTRLEALISRLLPGRRLLTALPNCTHHEDRAGVVCAATALATAFGHHVAVGDPFDGDIILPPTDAWGANITGGNSWLEPVLRQNVSVVRTAGNGHANHRDARVAIGGKLWFS
jgi:predicted nuclease with RNAse H fold